jgi:hypothetical protein
VKGYAYVQLIFYVFNYYLQVFHELLWSGIKDKRTDTLQTEVTFHSASGRAHFLYKTTATLHLEIWSWVSLHGVALKVDGPRKIRGKESSGGGGG